MLYEVITERIRILFPEGVPVFPGQPEVDRDVTVLVAIISEENGLDVAGIARKQFGPGSVPAVRRKEFGPSCRLYRVLPDVGKSRITSYNVCYTKLLRIERIKKRLRK